MNFNIIIFKVEVTKPIKIDEIIKENKISNLDIGEINKWFKVFL